MTKRARYGSGSIRAIGERRWEVRISVGRDRVTKRYRHVSQSVRGTKKEAEAALAALIAEVRAGRGGHSGTDATVRELVEQWLDIRKDTLSVTTYEAYFGEARFRLIPGLGDVAVRRLTVHDIDMFYRRLSRDEGLAASTIKQIHNILSGSLDQAVRWGWRQDNPARSATLPAGRSPDVRPPRSSVDVVAALAKRSRRRPPVRLDQPLRPRGIQELHPYELGPSQPVTRHPEHSERWSIRRRRRRSARTVPSSRASRLV